MKVSHAARAREPGEAEAIRRNLMDYSSDGVRLFRINVTQDMQIF